MVDARSQAKKDSLAEVEIALKDGLIPPLPPYPYGLQSWGNPYQPHPMAGKALLGGAKIQSGNKISSGRNKGKTRRKWYPYITAAKLRSEALGKDFTILITRSCVRTITKCGGLDQYLLGERPARLKELGPFGWKLRWLVLNSPQAASQRAEKKIEEPATFEEAMAIPSIKEELLKSQFEEWRKLKLKEARFERMVRKQWEGKDIHEYEFAKNSTLKKVDPRTLFTHDDMHRLLQDMSIKAKP
jgi:large subunit ribosomal protein L28